MLAGCPSLAAGRLSNNRTERGRLSTHDANTCSESEKLFSDELLHKVNGAEKVNDV